MADVQSALKNWSATPSSNSPTSATTIGSGLAPNLQQIQATLRNELGTRSASMTATSSVDIGSKDEGTVLISNESGSIAITSFGTVSAGISKLVTFAVSGGTLTLMYNAASLVLPGSTNIAIGNGDSLLAESLGGGNWKVHAFYSQSAAATQLAIQSQSYTAFTTGGTSSAFTLTPSPDITANAANQMFFVKLNAAPAGSPTLAVSGLAALGFKYYDSTGNKQFITSAVAPINWQSPVFNDGTDWMMLNPNRSQIQASGISAYTATATLTSADLGKQVYYNSASNGTLTLPSVVGIAIGSIISISNIIGAGTVTIARAGTSTIFAFSLSNVTFFTLTPGESIQLVTDGTNWVQVVGSKIPFAGQTPVDVTASRAVSTTYMNPNNYQLEVTVTMNHVTSAIATMVVDGVNVAQTSGNSATSIYGVLKYSVPPGKTYRVNQTSGTPAIILWTEMKAAT